MKNIDNMASKPRRSPVRHVNTTGSVCSFDSLLAFPRKGSKNTTKDNKAIFRVRNDWHYKDQKLSYAGAVCLSMVSDQLIRF